MTTFETRAILFDLDDTLLCTARHKWAQHQEAAKLFHGIELDETTLSTHWGKPSRELVEIFYEKRANTDVLLQGFRSLDHKYPKTIFEDTLPAINRLSASFVLGIVTNARKESAHDDLLRFEFPVDHFRFIHTFEDTGFYKPDPKAFDQAISLLHQEGITNITYVGDSVIDVQAAHNAGLNFIGVTTGVTSELQLRKVGARTIVDSLTQLIEIIE